MVDLILGNIKKDHYKMKVNSNKNSKEKSDCCVGKYDDKMHLTNKWRLKK